MLSFLRRKKPIDNKNTATDNKQKLVLPASINNTRLVTSNEQSNTYPIQQLNTSYYSVGCDSSSSSDSSSCSSSGDSGGGCCGD